MKNVQKTRRRWHLLGLGLLALALGMAGAAGGAPQDGKKQANQPTEKQGYTKRAVREQVGEQPPTIQPEKGEIHLYDAKYMAADQLASLITGVFGAENVNLRVTVDNASNRLVLVAPDSYWLKLEALLTKLDTKAPPAQGAGQRLVTFSLNGVSDDDDWFRSALNMLIPKNSNAKYTIDKSKNSLLVYGDDKTIEAVNDLCQALKSAADVSKKVAAVKEPQLQPLQVRLLWLVDAEQKGATDGALTGDLLKIVPVLAKLGINHPRIVSNCLVNTTLGGEFKSVGTAAYSGGARLDLSGRSRLVGKTPNLNIHLRIGTESPNLKESVEMASLETDIQAPLGHFVLLGMTPIQTGTSIFVIQVSEPE